jgi:Na+/phosphate symporter
MKNNNVQLVALLIVGIILVFICLHTFELSKANAARLSDLDDRMGDMEDAITSVAINTERSALGTAVIIESLAPLPAEELVSEGRAPIGFRQSHTPEV